MEPALERALSLRRTYLARSRRHVGIRPPAIDGLTAREREIVSLMTTGLTNREIAERLVITEGTVEVHVKHVLSKLGLRSRTQVAGWFVSHGPA
jgi:DNA-binding NarL/FixJ family response regulator